VAQTIISSRELDPRTGLAKKAAASGPVFITDYGRQAYVLMTIEDYQAIPGTEQSIAELRETSRL
jgi:hypothetical protein